MNETIFYIVIFVIYLIFQALSAKKKKKRPVTGTTAQPLPEATQRPAPGAEPTLNDALREIRQALGMETPATAAPPPRQTPPPAPRPKAPLHAVRGHGPELAEMAPQKSWSSEFKAYPTHYADSDFEELTTDGDRFGKAPKPKKPHRPAAKKQAVDPQAEVSTKVSRSTVKTRLSTPQAAREAFVLSEILGSPRAHKPF